MDFKNAVKALQIGKKEGKKFRLSTEFGKNPEEELPFPEYPRPQMRRENWTNLNGWWEYAFTETQKMPEQRDGKILVPFSPECDASGVKRQLLPKEYLWYFRTIQLPKIPAGKRLLLQFGAVDQDAVIYCNGKRAGGHLGGYLSFSVDLTPYLKTGENELAVKVRDETDTDWKGRGKQSLTPGGMFYTAQSGIWQTVWLESVPQNYIRSLHVTPLFDAHQVEITVEGEGQCMIDLEGKRFTFPAGVPAHVPVQSFRPWSPEHPTLYPFSVTLGDDTVYSYFAMRKCSVETDKDGVRRLFLNGKPYFHNGLLDQGYWPDGLYTAPSDDALVYDIQLAKDMGFNMLRKHIKVECDRWYYHCDRLGMLVWQDMPCGGRRYDPLIVSTPLVTGWHLDDSWYPLFGRTNVTARKAFLNELRDMVTTLYNHPCIAVWVPFNEGWGQFDSQTAVQVIRSVDKTRTIDPASGWHDQGFGDVRSLHVYFQKYRFQPDKLGRATLLSEFGGYVHRVEGHAIGGKSVGYKTCDAPLSLEYALQALYDEQIRPAIAQGLSAAVYTQLSDVEHELNGLVTYDRSIVKLPVQTLHKIFYIENE